MTGTIPVVLTCQDHRHLLPLHQPQPESHCRAVLSQITGKETRVLYGRLQQTLQVPPQTAPSGNPRGVSTHLQRCPLKRGSRSQCMQSSASFLPVKEHRHRSQQCQRGVSPPVRASSSFLPPEQLDSEVCTAVASYYVTPVVAPMTETQRRLNSTLKLSLKNIL